MPLSDSGDLRGLIKIFSSSNEVKKSVHFSYNKLMNNKAYEFFANFGNVQFTEILNTWESRTTFANKFQFKHSGHNYTLNVNENDTKGWRDLIDTNHCNFRGNQCPFILEFIINSDASVEKILTNLQLISNKVKPESITYTTTKDISDATLRQNDIGNLDDVIVYTDLIKTREDNASFNLGIFSSNAYYKDGKYFIQVGKSESFSRFDKSTRRIRDKYFRVRIEYSGEDYTYIYSVLSLYQYNTD
jgi:hypothetical protein